ncbi:MAG: hypothetical protein JXJ17_06975 [Anaerolineae bacterium]|nr:hypothetical protein [Anaerolineae bacterium]
MARPTVDPVRRSEAIYRRLLFAYPRSHRREYGESMVQLFRDQCRDAVRQGRLIRLWLQTLIDLLRSAPVEHVDAIKGGIMAIDRGVKPLPWWEIGLAVVPGILLAVSRSYYPLGTAAMVGLGLALIAVLVVMIARKELPAWGLFVLGLLIVGGLVTIGLRVADLIESRTAVNRQAALLLLMIPVWVVIGFMGWQYTRDRRFPKLAVALAGLIAAIILVSMGRFYYYTVLHKEGLLVLAVGALTGLANLAGMMLLPVMLGLPLARRHHSHALLLVIGAYSVWTFDSDFYAGYLLRDLPVYPFYVLALFLTFMVVGPLLLLRARSWRGQVIGLLLPVSIALISRVLVPLMIDAGRHALLIWLGDSMMSAAVLAGIGLALVLYRPRDDSVVAVPGEIKQPVFAGRATP